MEELVSEETPTTTLLTKAITSVTTVLTNTTSLSNGFAWRLLHLTAKLGYSVVFVLFTLIGMLWYFQEKLLFYPKSPQGLETPDKNPKPFQNPGQMNMAYEDVWIKTKDGCRLHAWLIKQKSPLDYTTLPTLVFFQGNAGNMGLRLTNILRLYENCRVNIFAVSYRGYGYSTGVPSENGVYIDAETALDFLISRQDVNSSKILIFGRSIGGAVAVDLAYKRSDRLRALIIENTFTSLREMADIVFPFLKVFSSLVSIAQRLFMDSLSKISHIEVPIMFISGLQDALVPPAHVARLYNAATASPLRHLYAVTNGTHNDTWQQAGMEYYQEISCFIAQALAAPYSSSTSTIPTTLSGSSAPLTTQHRSQKFIEERSDL